MVRIFERDPTSAWLWRGEWAVWTFHQRRKRCVRSWLPIGQALWLREEQVMQQVREMKSVSHAGE